MNYLYVYVDSQCRKEKTDGMTIAQNSSDNTLYFFSENKYASVKVTFRQPTGNLPYPLHMAYLGYDEDELKYKYGLVIPYSVTNFTIPSSSARLSVSFHCWQYDDTSKGGEAVCDSSIVVNKSSNSDVYDPAYNGTDISNLWRFLGQISSEISEGSLLFHIVTTLPSDFSVYEDNAIIAYLNDNSIILYRVDSSLDDGYEEVDLGSYYSQSEIDAMLANYVLSADLATTLLDYVTTATLAATLANYYTASEVDSLISTAISNVYQIKGSVVVTALNGLTKAEAMNGYVYNLTDDGDLINEDETTISVETGDNVVFIWNDGEWYWDKLAGTVDLSDYLSTSDYLTDSEIDTIYEEA